MHLYPEADRLAGLDGGGHRRRDGVRVVDFLDVLGADESFFSNPAAYPGPTPDFR